MASFSFSNVLGDLKTTLIGAVVAAVPVVIQAVESGTVNWSTIGPAVGIVFLTAFLGFVKKETTALQADLTPSGTV